jgi:hypothetical protein
MMNRFPLQLTVKDVDANAYAFSLLCWHERLVYGAGAAGLEEGAAARQLAGAAGRVGASLLSGVSRMLGGGASK